MFDKAFTKCFLAFTYIPDQYKTQEKYDKVISVGTFMLVFCPDKYKTQQMSDEAVDNYLVALTFIPDWSVKSKMFEKLNNALHTKDDILFYDKNFDKITFIVCQRHILAANLDEINLDNNFDFDPDTII